MKFKDRVTLLVVISMLAFNLYGQKTTLLSYEFGLSKKTINFNNPQGVVNFYNTTEGVPGLIITQQIYKGLYVETGIYNDFIGCDMLLENEFDTSNLILGQDQIQLPLRLQFKKELFDEKLNAFLSTGTSFVLGNRYSYFLYSEEGNTILTTNTLVFKKNYNLIEFGFGVDVFLTENFFLGLRYRTGFGFNDVINVNASTGNASDSNQVDYFLNSKGNYNAFVFGIGYRISSLWNK